MQTGSQKHFIRLGYPRYRLLKLGIKCPDTNNKWIRLQLEKKEVERIRKWLDYIEW
jgi:hypothetical protein